MLHAVRDIKEGEEICNTYISDLHHSARERGAELAKWGFECRCDACNGPTAVASEKRRRRMSEIHRIVDSDEYPKDAILKGTSKRPVKTALARLALCEELVDLHFEENLVGMDLAHAYNMCSHYALEACHILKAIDYAEREFEVEKTCVGYVHKLPESAEHWLGLLHTLAATNDRRFKAELDRQKNEEEKIQRKIEKEEARQTGLEEAKRRKEEDERLARQKQAEDERLRLQQESDEKAAKAESKKEKEVAKNAAKKAKRVIRAAVTGLKEGEAKKVASKQMETKDLWDVDVEVLIGKLSGEELINLAGRINDGADVKGVVAEALEKATGVGNAS